MENVQLLSTIMCCRCVYSVIESERPRTREYLCCVSVACVFATKEHIEGWKHRKEREQQ